MKIRWLAFQVALLLFAAPAYAAVEVMVSIAPQKWLVDRISGGLAATETLIAAGQDPHTFEPRPRAIAHLAKANIYFAIGLPFERRLLAKITDGDTAISVVDCAAGIEKIPFEAGEHHHHGEEADHDQSGDDPHVWLSAANLAIMADNIAQALIVADPARAATYRQNLTHLRQELIALDAQITKQLKPWAGATFYVFHPAFGSFAHRYDLRQEAVEIEGKSPTPKQIQHLIADARQDGVRVIFSQPQFDAKSAEAVARAINGRVVPLDALAYDAAANLKLMAEQIAQAMSEAND
ncbi:MAG: zinc ABC transporter substrate-binding protein [Desulfobulbaceae bacterium]|jgi:zinc transport system substrate-binding protein|nr:zinc ABC transporter substrate-binding protein [Desulfobulbaceae bacterium]